MAYCRVDGRVVYIGPAGSPAARERFAAIVAEWDRLHPDAGPAPVTVAVLAAAWLRHTRAEYSRSTFAMHRSAVRWALALYAGHDAAAFGPAELRAVQRAAADSGRLCRREVNRAVRLVRQCFGWGVAESVLPAESATNWHAMRTVRGIRPGRLADPPPVGPVPDADVDAALAFMRPAVAAMVRVQRLTGMRPAEVCAMTPGAIDRSAEPWMYRPARHKLAHRGVAREVHLGPRARAVLDAWAEWDRADEPVFSARASEAERNAERRDRRATPATPSSRARAAAAAVRERSRPPGDAYTPAAYRRAVARACDAAGVDRWSPNRLRHTRASEVRAAAAECAGPVHALEHVQAVLGHASIATTQVYAARRRALAASIADASG